MTYNNADRLTQGVLGNSAKTLYSYDNADRLTQVENKKSDNSVINRFTYLLDAVGNRTKMTEANGDYTDYGYDNVYQLLSEVKKNSGGSTLYSYVYTYDNVGNRLTMTTGGQQTSYTYDSNNRMLTAGAVSYGYDANGNTISKTGPTSYLYDYENHLVKVTYADGSKNWFAYNGDGIRFSKRDSAGPVRFVYDGTDVLQEMDLVSGNTSVRYLQGFGGLLKQRRSSTDRWYQYDGLGSARALTNSAQTVTDTYSYEAFGNLLSSSGSTVNPYRYVGGLGYYADDDSDFMLLTLRYYDAPTGRFTTTDPAKADPHGYIYVGNNPIIFVDPLGLQRMLLREADIFGGDDIRYPWYMAPEPLPNPRIINPLHASGRSSGKVVECLAYCIAEHYGLTALGIGVWGAGQQIIPKTLLGSRGLGGSTTGTSVAAVVLRKVLPFSVGRELPAPVILLKQGRTAFVKGLLRTAPTIGGALGRWVPIVGYGLLAYDAFRILQCVHRCLDDGCEE